MGAQARATIRLIVAIGIFAPLVACNSLLGELDRIKKKYDEKNGPKPCTENCAAAPASYTIGGTVTGLAGTGLVLQNNGADNLSITANGSFTFSTAIADGASFNVTVLTQPSVPNQLCSVTNATGTVAGVNVTSVAVNCVNSYTIGGTVTGLAGTGLVLQNNGGNNLTIATNGSFTFSTASADGASYNVTVLTQPSSPNQMCSVTNGTGTVAGVNVTSVAVNCVNSYTIGGTVTGLAGTGVVLQNNAGNNLNITANGSFTFTTTLVNGTSYNVSVLTQPSSPNQICSVTNATGTVAGANVTSVAVNCVSSYTIGGTVTGLAGTGLVLQNNGADDLSLASNGSFTFSLPLSDGEAYNVTVKDNPTGQICRIDNDAAAVAGGNVTNVAVTCSGSDFTWVQDAYLKASNAEAYDNFGSSVAISGSTIVVGAPLEDSNQTTITNNDGQPGHPDNDSASNSGAVYVFKRDGSGDWIQDAYLKGIQCGGR
jgi:hypothetical protein